MAQQNKENIRNGFFGMEQNLKWAKRISTSEIVPYCRSLTQRRYNVNSSTVLRYQLTTD